MIVDVRVESVINIDIESDEAFRVLCETLHMNCVLNEDVEFFVKKDEFGDNCVYRTYKDCDVKHDDRGDLFIALRNVAVNMFPNLSFRNANYIYNK